jgi:hypothetical protein
MKEEHTEDLLLADLIANQPDNDREPSTRRILHKCGHWSNKTMWGKYRLEDRFQSSSEHNCPVCMQYESAKHCFDFSDKNFGRSKKTGIISLHAMINMAELYDVSA